MKSLIKQSLFKIFYIKVELQKSTKNLRKSHQKNSQKIIKRNKRSEKIRENQTRKPRKLLLKPRKSDLKNRKSPKKNKKIRTNPQESQT